jgi:GNAT superfamily N-acetyltransferase
LNPGLRRYTSRRVAAQEKTTAEGAAGFRVRTARPGDAEGLASLLKELGYANAADVSIVNWVRSHPEMEVLVAADGHDRPVGVLTLSHRPQLRMKGRIATVDELVVAQAWRRKGVGRALITRAVEKARSLSCKRMELVTHRGRGEYVRQFYEACGFAEADSLVLRHRELDFQKH